MKSGTNTPYMYQTMNIKGKRMSFQALADSLFDYRAILGWSSAGTYWIFEHYETIVGMVVSIAVAGTSIALQIIKVRSVLAEERRKEARFQQEMRQDEELHDKNFEDE